MENKQPEVGPSDGAENRFDGPKEPLITRGRRFRPRGHLLMIAVVLAATTRNTRGWFRCD